MHLKVFSRICKRVTHHCIKVESSRIREYINTWSDRSRPWGSFDEPSLTTGNSSFAVCHGHSAKTKKHSVKDLPSVTLGKEHTAATVPANSSFVECFLSGTRQRLCRELKTTLGQKKYVTEWKRSRHVCWVSNIRHLAKLAFLPCVKVWALSKSGLFAMC